MSVKPVAWTPGPWEVNPINSAAISTKIDPQHIVADCLGGLCTGTNAGANARLIASAPELAEMLGRLVNAILRKSAENPDVVVDEADSLLARITPK